jgi:hypothetical protein
MPCVAVHVSVMTAGAPVAVQHTQLDSCEAELALLSELAYPEN